MKRLFLLAAGFSLIAVLACKKDSSKKMTVLKDCTGVYLRSDGKDYHVCSSEKLEAFADGTTVIASYKKIMDCKDQQDKIICMMYHENEGWIKVMGVR